MKIESSYQTGLCCQTLTLGFLILILPASFWPLDARVVSAQETSQARSPKLESQLKLAGENRSELEKALESVSEDQRPGLDFLLKHMSEADLKSLSSEFLLSNLELAYRARREAPWQLSDEMFLNEVLPYANIDEPRDPWRKKMFELCKPIVKDCKTPAEAAQRLNETVFQKLSVKYSTKRKRANQSPKESIEQGLASCTGLSIILVDACRSVGVPARLAGIPSWKNKRGNHTWVEVWDGQWHFTGAAEPNKRGLNHTWFQADAALADPNSKLHSIYAVSFAKTETRFPMVWSPEKRVFAENVTKRYLKTDQETSTDESKINVMFRAWEPGKKKRAVVEIEVVCDRCQANFTGKTKAGTHDMNDMLTFQLDPNSTYDVKVHRLVNGKKSLAAEMELKTSDQSNELVEFVIDENDDAERAEREALAQAEAAGDSLLGQLNPSEQKMLGSIADELFFTKDAADKLVVKHPEAARQVAWNRYRASMMAWQQEPDFDQKRVVFDKHTSPYTIKKVGKRPENGWPLFIAMHGGGNVPKKFNDSQWRHMQIYYKDQADLEGYKYLALRAPNDTWNGFYDDYVYPLVENLIRQFIAFGDVDPNRVFIMGYSHGGYGAFSIGPKIPYRFAAIHASAAAPTDGQTSARTLRNTRFSFMVGEKDTAYGRAERCQKFSKQIEELKAANPKAYPVEFMFKKGFGHGGLPDRDMIRQMYDFVRNPAPKHVTWEMTDSVVKRFFWLKCDQPSRGQLIDVKIENNVIEIETEACQSFSILLDNRLIDPSREIELKIAGSSSKVAYEPSFETLCKTMAETGDPNLAFDFEIKVDLK